MTSIRRVPPYTDLRAASNIEREPIGGHQPGLEEKQDLLVKLNERAYERITQKFRGYEDDEQVSAEYER